MIKKARQGFILNLLISTGFVGLLYTSSSFASHNYKAYSSMQSGRYGCLGIVTRDLSQHSMEQVCKLAEYYAEDCLDEWEVRKWYCEIDEKSTYGSYHTCKVFCHGYE